MRDLELLDFNMCEIRHVQIRMSDRILKDGGVV
jgi:hypothetical protein